MSLVGELDLGVRTLRRPDARTLVDGLPVGSAHDKNRPCALVTDLVLWLPPYALRLRAPSPSGAPLLHLFEARLLLLQDGLVVLRLTRGGVLGWQQLLRSQPPLQLELL